MCNTLTISTDYPKDLAKFDDEHLFFEKTDKSSLDNILHHPHKYEIATLAKGGCSCHLRIFGEDLAKEIGFCELQDWLDEQEQDEDNMATWRYFEIIKEIVNQGFKVDSFMSWNDDIPEKINAIQVFVNELPKGHFALFENAYFDYNI